MIAVAVEFEVVDVGDQLRPSGQANGSPEGINSAIERRYQSTAANRIEYGVKVQHANVAHAPSSFTL